MLKRGTVAPGSLEPQAVARDACHLLHGELTQPHRAEPVRLPCQVGVLVHGTNVPQSVEVQSRLAGCTFSSALGPKGWCGGGARKPHSDATPSAPKIGPCENARHTQRTWGHPVEDPSLGEAPRESAVVQSVTRTDAVQPLWRRLSMSCFHARRCPAAGHGELDANAGSKGSPFDVWTQVAKAHDRGTNLYFIRHILSMDVEVLSKALSRPGRVDRHTRMAPTITRPPSAGARGDR